MIGDSMHQKLLKDGWTWNGEAIYQKTYDLKGIMAGQTLELRGQVPSELELSDKAIKYAREHTWDFYLMNRDTKWIRICIHRNFLSAVKAVLGIWS